MTKNQDEYELPEILYDEPIPGNPPNPFPFINVKNGKKMPNVIFLEERKETGEYEVGPDGVRQEIVDCLMHKFVDLEVLKEKLPPHLNDMVRVSLGMLPLSQAKASGQEIIDRAMANVEKKKIQNDLDKKTKNKEKKKKGN